MSLDIMSDNVSRSQLVPLYPSLTPHFHHFNMFSPLDAKTLKFYKSLTRRNKLNNNVREDFTTFNFALYDRKVKEILKIYVHVCNL